MSQRLSENSARPVNPASPLHQRERLALFILVMRFIFSDTHQIDTVVGRFDNLEV
jgi:hypothetical protein